MKKILTGMVALCIVSAAVAQKKAPVKKTAGTAAAPVFKSQNDSLSYSIGMSLASFYKQQGITNINTTLLNRAINDIKVGKTLLTEEQMTQCVNNYLQAKTG